MQTVVIVMHDGILLVDKPQDMSSHDVVVAVRRMTGIRQVGHTGTLDPSASGLLILCLGRATKFARFLEVLDKTYWTVMQLGIRTNTQDATGNIVSHCQVPRLGREQLEEVLHRFTGSLQQTPPMYSAIKHQGQRLYRLARRGLTVARQPRQISVQQLRLLDTREGKITFAVTCSKGTYIRTLCQDIGDALGCGAHMACLQRCQIGPFHLSQTYSLAGLHKCAQQGRLADKIISLPEALSFLPSLMLTTQQYEALRLDHRKVLASIWNSAYGPQLSGTCYRLCTKSNGPFAIMHQLSSSPEKWRCQYFDVSHFA
jgi:tRNA pseudouridine55 synthase